MTFNINETVQVKLTERGREIYHAYYDELGIPKSQHPDLVVDSEGFCTFQLWGLMQKFGSHLCNGCPQLFDSDLKFDPTKFTD